ncbi:MAG: hypothetical protein ACR2IE_05890 [Candidatus Sumerlaeaceae bacterium]
MKTLRFLEKRSTWVLMLCSLPLAPIIVVSFPRMPVVENFPRIGENIKQHYHPSDKPDATAEIQRLLILEPAQATRLRTIGLLQLESGELMYLQALRQVVEKANEEFGSRVESYGKLAQQASFDTGQLFTKSAEQSNLFSNIWPNLNYLSQFSRQLAWKAIAEGQTTSALNYLASSARTCDPFINTAFSGWGAMYARGQAIAMAEDLLHRAGSDSLGASIEQLDFSSINAVAALSTFFDQSWVLWNEGSLQSAIMRFTLTGLVNQQYVSNAVWYLAQDAQHFTSPDNVRWAKAVTAAATRIQGPQAGQLALMPTANPYTPGGIFAMHPWTEVPALAAQFKRVVRTEPNLLPPRMKLENLMTGVPPEMAALYTYGFLLQLRNGENLYTELRAVETYRQALRAACAAQQFKADRERWPTNIEELVPQYLAKVPETQTTTSTQDTAQLLITPGKFPYGPLHCEMVPVNKSNLPRLLGLIRAIHGRTGIENWNCEVFAEETPSTTSTEYRAKLRIQSSHGGDNLSPLELLGLAEKLKAMRVLHNVRVTPEAAAGEQNIWRAYRTAAFRDPAFKSLLYDAGAAAIIEPPPGSEPNTEPGPLAVEADVVMPREAFIIRYTADSRGWTTARAQLNIDSLSEGNPAGELVVCAEKWY